MTDTLRMNPEQEAAFAEINNLYPVATWRISPTTLVVAFECDDGDTGYIEVDGTWEWV